MSALFTKDEAPGTNVGKPIVNSNALFVANKQMSAEDIVKTINRRSSTWSGRYAGLLNIQYNDDDVSGYKGQGISGNYTQGTSAHVKVPVARIHGGVEDAETGMINPYGSIVVGKFIIGDGTHTLDLDLSALEENIARINKGRSVGAAEDRLDAALAEVPDEEQMEKKRQIIKDRGEDRMVTAEPASFDEMMYKAGQQAEQNVPAVPQVPPPQPAFVQQPTQPPPTAYNQIPQQSVLPQIDMQTFIAQEIAKAMTAQEPAKSMVPEPEEPPLDLTPGIDVTLKGWFGTNVLKYKGYEKQDNMLILMYNIGDNICEPPPSEQAFQISINNGNQTETFTVGFVGISFKVESLRIGFQVYIVK